MKTTGEIRKIDRIGRVCLPKDLIKNYNLENGDFVGLSLDNAYISLKKFVSNNLLGDETQDNTFGTIRRIDQFGRICLPKDIRKSFNLEIGDSIELLADDIYIYFKKYMPICPDIR